jgi:hypothetical protein
MIWTDMTPDMRSTGVSVWTAFNGSIVCKDQLVSE